jgi:toxin-antitoxin system PIN domain toxin
MSVLLDGSVLVALMLDDHVHHTAARSWFLRLGDGFATCPITQGTLLRLLIQEGQSAAAAKSVLLELSAHPDHEFWVDALSYRDVSLDGVIGRRQVTDAYLAQLARAHQARLATFDGGLASLHPDVVDLVPR